MGLPQKQRVTRTEQLNGAWMSPCRRQLLALEIRLATFKSPFMKVCMWKNPSMLTMLWTVQQEFFQQYGTMRYVSSWQNSWQRRDMMVWWASASSPLWWTYASFYSQQGRQCQTWCQSEKILGNTTAVCLLWCQNLSWPHATDEMKGRSAMHMNIMSVR